MRDIQFKSIRLALIPYLRQTRHCNKRIFGKLENIMTNWILKCNTLPLICVFFFSSVVDASSRSPFMKLWFSKDRFTQKNPLQYNSISEISLKDEFFVCFYCLADQCLRSISGSISECIDPFRIGEKYFIFQQLDQIRRNNSKQKRSQGKENFYGIAIFPFFSWQCHSFTLFCSIFNFFFFFLCHS